MSKALLITKKELKSFFNSLSAYIIIVIFLLITGWFFSNTLFLRNQANMRILFDLIPIFFIPFIPAITMGFISKEKNSGTIELLTTFPINSKDIVIGKFLTSLALIAITLSFTVINLITIALLGNVDFGPVIGGYIGLLFLGAAYSAIGVFGSSLTDNQIASFIISLGIIFFLFMLDKVTMFVPDFLAGIFNYLSIDYHFNNITKGVIDTRDIIYFLSIIVLFLTLTTHIVESRKWK